MTQISFVKLFTAKIIATNSAHKKCRKTADFNQPFSCKKTEASQPLQKTSYETPHAKRCCIARLVVVKGDLQLNDVLIPLLKFFVLWTFQIRFQIFKAAHLDGDHQIHIAFPPNNVAVYLWIDDAFVLLFKLLEFVGENINDAFRQRIFFEP